MLQVPSPPRRCANGRVGKERRGRVPRDEARHFEIVSFHALDRGVALDPRHRVDAQSPVHVPAADTVPYVILATIYFRDGDPTASEGFDPSRPSPREWTKGHHADHSD